MFNPWDNTAQDQSISEVFHVVKYQYDSKTLNKPFSEMSFASTLCSDDDDNHDHHHVLSGWNLSTA